MAVNKAAAVLIQTSSGKWTLRPPHTHMYRLTHHRAETCSCCAVWESVVGTANVCVSPLDPFD